MDKALEATFGDSSVTKTLQSWLIFTGVGTEPSSSETFGQRSQAARMFQNGYPMAVLYSFDFDFFDCILKRK